MRWPRGLRWGERLAPILSLGRLSPRTIISALWALRARQPVRFGARTLIGEEAAWKVKHGDQAGEKDQHVRIFAEHG
jgi:hypothetical protein